jgi:hypothetical protein
MAMPSGSLVSDNKHLASYSMYHIVYACIGLFAVFRQGLQYAAQAGLQLMILLPCFTTAGNVWLHCVFLNLFHRRAGTFHLPSCLGAAPPTLGRSVMLNW